MSKFGKPILQAILVAVLVFSAGCHTFEVRQFDSVAKEKSMEVKRAAVIMATYKTLEGDQTKQPNKLFAEQLIVSLQQQGIDVAERQKVESLLLDSDLVRSGAADLTETERAKRLGRLLKVDLIFYGDAIVNKTYYTYFRRLFFSNAAEMQRLQTEANQTGVVKRNGYPVLAQHAIGLSGRAVNTATGEIVWVGFRSTVSADWVEDDNPESLTNFGVIQGVSDELVEDLLQVRM